MGIFKARILEWFAMPFSRGCFWPRVWTQVSHIAGRYFHHLNHKGRYITSNINDILRTVIHKFNCQLNLTWFSPQSCPTLCHPMDCSTTGFPVLHHLLVLAQTHVCWVGAFKYLYINTECLNLMSMANWPPSILNVYLHSRYWIYHICVQNHYFSYTYLLNNFICN